MGETVLIIPDIHFPWGHPGSLSAIAALCKAYKPTHVVQLGDLMDQYFASRYDKDSNLKQPGSEWAEAGEQAAELWRTVRAAAPGAKCFQLIGNHDVRASKRLREKLSEVDAGLGLSEYIASQYRFEGVTTLADDKSHLKLQINGKPVVFFHGVFSKLIDHLNHFQCSVVVGHSHRAEVQFENRNGKTLFALNAGYLGAPEAPVFRYTSTTIKKWTLGFGLIDAHGPRFIPMESVMHARPGRSPKTASRKPVARPRKRSHTAKRSASARVSPAA